MKRTSRKRLREVEAENARPKRAVAELALDKSMCREATGIPPSWLLLRQHPAGCRSGRGASPRLLPRSVVGRGCPGTDACDSTRIGAASPVSRRTRSANANRRLDSVVAATREDFTSTRRNCRPSCARGAAGSPARARRSLRSERRRGSADRPPSCPPKNSLATSTASRAACPRRPPFLGVLPPAALLLRKSSKSRTATRSRAAA